MHGDGRLREHSAIFFMVIIYFINKYGNIICTSVAVSLQCRKRSKAQNGKAQINLALHSPCTIF